MACTSASKPRKVCVGDPAQPSRPALLMCSNHSVVDRRYVLEMPNYSESALLPSDHRLSPSRSRRF